MGDNLISRCKIAAKDCLLYNTEKVSEYGKIYMEAADRITELQAQVEKYKSEIRESCEDMRSEYRTCDLAHELGEKNKELEVQLDEQKNNYADQMQYGAEQWLRAEKAEAQLTEFQKLVDETDDVKKILNNP